MGVKFENIRKCFGNVEVLKDVTFEAEEGKVTWIVGENGCGKTTLVKLALDLLRKDQGEVFFNEKKIGKVRNEVAVLFDDVPCYENINVKTNLYLLSNRARIEEKELDNVIETFELRRILKQRAGSLSLGQRHRLIMAACMLRHPKFFFLDEPTIGLDVNSFKQLERMFMSLKQSGTTIIVTGHDLMYLNQLADRIVLLENGVATEIEEFVVTTLQK